MPFGVQPNGNPYDSGQFEGDIVLDNSTIERISEGTLSSDFDPVGVASDDTKYLWKQHMVYYIYDSSIDNHLKVLIRAAMQDITTKTCIGFSPRTSENDYIKFYRGQGCFSFVGRKGGEQNLSLGPGCNQKGIILHEIMHALGFFHTHTRPDRDSYIRVNYNNIDTNHRNHFNKYTPSQVTTQGSPYDFKSILHLPNDAFNINGQNTMEALMNRSMQLGQIIGLTDIDVQIINDLYKCGTPGCYHALVGIKILPDSKMTSSTEHRGYYDHEARLHNRVTSQGLGSWCSTPTDSKPWLQIEFQKDVTLNAMATQGRPPMLFARAAYIKSFNLNYTYDPSSYWSQYHKTIIGNFDGTSVQYTKLRPAISGRYIRIIPLRQLTPQYCIRLEFYGCER